MSSDRTQEARERAERTKADDGYDAKFPLWKPWALDRADDVLFLADRVSTLETALRTLRQWDMLDSCADGPWAKRMIDAALAEGVNRP